MDAFSLVIDHEQNRVARDRLLTQITGLTQMDDVTGKQLEGWNMASGNVDAAGDPLCWVEPVTGKLMLRPAPLSRLWQTTATGIFARLRKANLTLTTASAWEDNEFTNQAAVSVAMKDKSLSEEARTSATYSKNRPFYIAPVFFASGDDNRGYLDCGWGAAASGVAIRFYVSGRCEIRKGGELVAVHTWSGSNYSPQKANGQRVGFILLPIPPNALIVYSTWGGGFQHIFTDLDPLDLDNEVAPASYFRFQCVDMGTDVELAPIKFPSSGYVDSVNTFFERAPETGLTPDFLTYRVGPGVGTHAFALSLVTADGSAAFVPDGAENECRIRMTLTGDGDSTYYICGTRAKFESEIGLTPDEELDITEYLTELRLSAAMAPGSTRVTGTVRNPFEINELDPSNSRRIISTENRPAVLRLGTQDVIDGVAERPSFDASATDDTYRVFMEIRDRWKLLEEYRFTEPFSLDGVTVADAVRDIVAVVGIEEDECDISPEAESATIEFTLDMSQGRWTFMVTPSDTGATVLMKLQEHFFPDWFLNFRPTETGVMFWFKSPADMGELPALTLYDTVAAAIADGATKREVYYSYHQTSPGTEFNRLSVQGKDVLNRPIIKTREDADSQDPTLPFADRGDEWTGTMRKAGIEVPGLRSAEMVEAALDALWRRAFYRRTLAEWESELMLHPETGLPLWVGDVVTLGEIGDFRIQSLDVPLDFEPWDEDSDGWRRARYMGEKIQMERDDSQGVGHVRQTETSLMELALWGWKKVRTERGTPNRRTPASVGL